MMVMMMGRKWSLPILAVLLAMASIQAVFFERTYPKFPRLAHRATAKSGQLDLSGVTENDLKIDNKELNKSVEHVEYTTNLMTRAEQSLGWSQIDVKKGTPSHGQFIISSPDNEALDHGRNALLAEKATHQLMMSFCSTDVMFSPECADYVASHSMLSTSLGKSCQRYHKQCEHEEIFSRYRSINGSCNNYRHRPEGASFTGYRRLLPPMYSFFDMPRRAVSKELLPWVRVVSTGLVQNADIPDHKLTLAVMQWSQFIEHDLTHTATRKMLTTGSTIECCEADGRTLLPRYTHDFCWRIAVPANDAFYSQHGVNCMSYVRSVQAFRPDCNFGPVDQLNQATHFLDGSHIYGSTPQRSARLRSFINGQLKTSKIHKFDYLPLSEKPNEDCQYTNADGLCFLAGDSRVNYQPQMTAMHILWMREHNRIANELSRLNQRWDDETLFQEARRIVIAEIQQITYNGWMPEILDKPYLKSIHSPHHEYNRHFNASISNSFATAALRAYNSLIDGNLKLYKEDRKVNTTINLRNYFNKPNIIGEPGYLDGLVRGLATQPSQKMDLHYHSDITNHLFSNGKYGLDILALDIQRSRDHGLAPYTSYRKFCGLPKVKDFRGFSDVMSAEAVKTLSKIYEHPDDVDLIAGGLSERSHGNSLYGPTFSCILSEQFLRTRRGDRYFFSNENQPSPFSRAQIHELEKITLARIFCDNADGIKSMQPNVFRRISRDNPLMNCQSDYIPSLNLKLWLDAREIYY